MVVGALQGLAAGAWVILSPPTSYEGIGATLTVIWGALIVAGSALVLVGHLARVHQIEIPGLVFMLTGIVIYIYLSWDQVLTTSPGSGPRALLIGQLAAMHAARLLLLLVADARARARLDEREATDG
ncbi:hypothetical protein ACXET9_07355 [Brachybacterium sp. DNPG3]